MRAQLRSHARRRGRRGQAMIEFAFCLPLFLIVFFGCIDAALWTIQSSAAVAAAEEAARVAASACGAATNDFTPGPIVVTDQVKEKLSQALFGTKVVAWNPAGLAAGSCPTSAAGSAAPCPSSPQAVETALHAPRTVVICARDVPPPCGSPSPTCTESPSVEVEVVGYLASLVPPAYNLGWRAGEIPIQVGVRTHAQRFNT